MSSPKIAKLYRRDPKSIRFFLRKNNIPVRTKSEARSLLSSINIPRDQLSNLYLKQKLSSPKIAKVFNCSAGFIRKRLRDYAIRVRSVQEALPLSNASKYHLRNFNGGAMEKSYLIGLRKGDLNIAMASKYSQTIFVHTSSTKIEMIRLVEESFAAYGHIAKSGPHKNGAFSIRCSLNRSFDFLLSNDDKIENWILGNKNYFAAFLAGYTDAEGTFCLCGGNAVFSIRSQDKNILHQIRSKLVGLKIFLRPPQIARGKGTKDNQGTISNQDIWAIWIHQKDALLRLIDLLIPYLKHPDKQKRVKVALSNILERNRRYGNKKGTRWHREYLKEGIKI